MTRIRQVARLTKNNNNNRKLRPGAKNQFTLTEGRAGSCDPMGSGEQRARHFVMESLALAIEKECVPVVKEILTIGCQTRVECRRLLALLQQVRTAFKAARPKREASLAWTRSGRHVAWMKRIEWSEFIVGKSQCLLGDTMLHYACRHGKTCFIDVLLDLGEFASLFNRIRSSGDNFCVFTMSDYDSHLFFACVLFLSFDACCFIQELNQFNIN